MHTIDSLEQIKKQITNTNPSLLSQTMVGQNTYQNLRSLFSQQDFLINDCEVVGSDSHYILFAGIFDNLFSWENVSAKFCLLDHEGDRHSVFSITPPDDVTADDYLVQYRTEANTNGSIAESDEILLDFYVEAIDFIEQKRNIIFSSTDWGETQIDQIITSNFSFPLKSLKKGVNFPVNLQIEDEIGDFFSEILGGTYTGKTECDGLVFLTDSGPYFKFIKRIQTEKSIGPLTLVLNEMAMSFPLTESPEMWPAVLVNGSLQSQGEATIFSVNTELDLYYQDLSITLSEFPTLSEWIALAKIGTLTNYFSGTLASLLDIKLSYLNIVFNLADLWVSEFSLSLTTKNDVYLIADLISLKPTLNLTVYDPFKQEADYLELEGELSGIWQLGSTQFETSMLYPDMTFYAAMSEGQILDVDAMAEQIFAGITLPEIAFTRMELQGNFEDGSYAVDLEVTGDWDITESVSLAQIQMSMTHFDSESEYTILATFNVANIDVLVMADYDSANGGWEFNGSIGYGQEIPIGRLIEDLASKFGEVVLPSSIEDLTIQNLRISFHTISKSFLFTCRAKFPVDGQEVDMTVTIAITRQEDDSYKKDFGGQIVIGGLQFDLFFSSDKTSKTFIATYANLYGRPLNVRTLVADASENIAAYIPSSLQITLQDALFAYSKYEEKSTFLFGLNLSARINLSSLPLVGKEFPPEQTVGVDDLQLLIASQDLIVDEADAFNNLIPDTVTKIPLQPTGNQGAETSAVQKGLNVSATLQFGALTEILALPVASEDSPDGSQSETTFPPSGNTTRTTTTAVTTADNAQWYSLQKSFGPVHFERIGVQYKEAVLSFLLDASLSVVGLTLSLEGLSVGSPLNKFEPKFDLRGLGIDYENGPVEIGGAFLKGKIIFDGQEYTDYSGTAIMRTETFTLAAIGSYVQLDVGPSLFVYAFLDYPLGGPAFFFVTGLAAGFGYNRLLHAPSVEQVHTFPLVEEAMRGEGEANLAAELAKLQPYIPPSVGDYFLAIGVRFTSFKMIDSFILVTAKFGHGFELDVVGLSTLVLPSPDLAGEGDEGVTPVAEAQLALRATFIPDDGFFGIKAQLTDNSFLLDRKCHLTGGFAFYSWFDDSQEGDFVLTVGGYHPQFSRPSHYPTVPRLGFNWQVNEHLNFKGTAYFALTPANLMAGCTLSASWHEGNLQAWFDAGLNFLMNWKPYHYEARFKASIGATYTFHAFGTHHVSTHADVDMRVWGPDFAGQAHVQWTVISFTIAFGAGARKKVESLDWTQFQHSFLPDNDQICTINLKSGLVNQKAAKDGKDTQQSDREDLGVVNPKTLCLIIDSVIPIQRAYRGNQGHTELDHTGATTSFSIGTMDLKNENIISTQTISIMRDPSDDHESVEAAFEFEPLTKNLPTALWGSHRATSLHGEQMVSDLLTGYEIHAKRPAEAPDTECINYKCLQKAVALDRIDNAFRWSQLTPFDAKDLESEAAREEICCTLYNSDVGSKRAAIANALFDDISLDLKELKANDFLSTPKIIEPSPEVE